MKILINKIDPFKKPKNTDGTKKVRSRIEMFILSNDDQISLGIISEITFKELTQNLMCTEWTNELTEDHKTVISKVILQDFSEQPY